MKIKKLHEEIRNDKKIYLPSKISKRIYYVITNNINNKIYKTIKWCRIKRYYEQKNKKNIINLFLYVFSSFIFNRLSLKYNIELPEKFGSNLKIYHLNIVINRNSIIGNDVKLHGNNCIGAKDSKINSECPIIGNNVDIGYGATIIGNIKVGDNSVIGAGSLVLKDVPANSVVAGNPAKKI